MYFTAEGLHKEFHSVTVDASLQAEKGTMTCIVGPSGSGKSTILKMIAGLEEAPEAKITLNNREISKAKIRDRGIGMVFQTAALFDHLSVEDNVAYGLICKGEKKAEARRRANIFLEVFNLTGFGKRMPETLSGGEAQRVSLARTLIIEPELVLFDEPLSALDTPLRKKLAGEIRSLQQKLNFTGIMVTHDLAEAKALGDNILIIKEGKIVWQGPASDFDEGML